MRIRGAGVKAAEHQDAVVEQDWVTWALAQCDRMDHSARVRRPCSMRAPASLSFSPTVGCLALTWFQGAFCAIASIASEHLKVKPPLCIGQDCVSHIRVSFQAASVHAR